MARRAKSAKSAAARPRVSRRRTVPGNGGPTQPADNTTATAGAAVAGAAPGKANVTARFYCQGIGDCHLLRFPKDGGGDFWMLIDCGIHSSITNGTKKIKDIVDNIASLTHRLDVIVLTHEQAAKARAAGGTAYAEPVANPVKQRVRKPPTPSRRLRVYALDPSIGKSLESMAVNETTLLVPWDDIPSASARLRPGPVGEYLEVVDVDPASNRVYDPVDLNDDQLLAQDGWSPSEGNPQFHQQMVYAVAMTTIAHFEQALGRKALWAPRYAQIGDAKDPDKIAAYEVKRLRLYPHARGETGQRLPTADPSSSRPPSNGRSTTRIPHWDQKEP
jgi:hypothetical protein